MCRVSILVFLEWPLGPCLDGEGIQIYTVFQSLFFWNGLWDHGIGGGTGGVQRVSILVFLEWPLGQNI